jgi:hypothetical protein
VYYFGPSSPEKRETTDNLMLTQGWMRFKWENILDSGKAVFEFLPELHGPLLTAGILDRNSGKPVSDASIYLTHPGKQSALVHDLSDDRGMFLRFQTLEEVMGEYIAEVRVRRRSDKFLFRVSDRPNNVFFDLDPLVFI